MASPGRSMAVRLVAVGWLWLAAVAHGAPQPLVTVTFIQEWPVADAFWIPWTLGRQKGFYAAEGIDLRIVAPPTVADTMKFLGTGRADVGFTTIMDVVFARDQGVPVKAIGRYGSGNNWGIFGKTGTVLTVRGLKGKTIGVYNDAWTKAQLSLVLGSAGLKLSDVTTVAASDDTVPLLLQNKVDAITGLTNAEGSELSVFGQHKPAFIAAAENGVPNAPIFLLAGNETWLAKNPALAKAFLRATRRSIAYAIEHSAEGLDVFTHTHSKAYDPAYLRQQWADTIPRFGAMSGDLMKLQDSDWVPLLKAAKDLGLTRTLLDPAQCYTNLYTATEGS